MRVNERKRGDDEAWNRSPAASRPGYGSGSGSGHRVGGGRRHRGRRTVLLSACGPGLVRSDGRRTLRAGGVTVSYPDARGWSAVARGDLGRDDVAAVLERDSGEVARIAVRLRFMEGGNEGAAGAAPMASLQPGAGITGSDRLVIDGRAAEKTRYGHRDPPGGTAYRGVDLVALDSGGEPPLVRINTAGDALPGTQGKRAVRSVGPGGGDGG